jgi:hypothetical protein
VLTREEKVAKACELRAAGELSLKKIGERLGVTHTTVAEWTQHLRPACRVCGFALRKSSPDGRCGFCIEEDECAAGIAVAA